MDGDRVTWRLEILAQYRLQWRCAEEVAEHAHVEDCIHGDAHVADTDALLAAASVAAHRATDETGVRWAEPAIRGR